MRFQRKKSWGSIARLFLFATGILLMLALSACDTIAPSTGADPNATPVVNSGTSTPDNSNATPTATTSGTTPTATSTQATQPSTTPTAVVPFRITSVNAVSPSKYSGSCGSTKTITITGTIYAPANNAGGTATYEWAHSNNSVGAHHTITFAPGVTALNVSDSWSLSASQGDGKTSFWAELKTLSPETWTSSHATFSFTCKRELTGVSASGTCSVAKIPTFNATFAISPSPSTSSITITYTWKRSNGTSSAAYTLTVPAGQTTASATPDVWAAMAKGSYTDKISVTSPSKVTSNTAKVTC